MSVLQITMSLFIFLESLNIIVLYTNPKSSKGNGMGVFNEIHRTDTNDSNGKLIKYLITWVANAKLIFVALGLVIVLFGSEQVLLYSSIAFVCSILIFYVTLYPIILDLDRQNEITPKGYSKTLAIMIFAFVLIFVVGILIHLFSL